MYAQVQRWLSDRMSLDATLMTGAGFESLIAERLTALGCGDEREYVGVLERSEEEAEHLAGSIAVPETWFFRYPLSFDLLVGHLERRLREGAGTLRMVSVGCASGEEAYGMAMAALHAGWAADRVKIDAFDRSQAALGRAKIAEYGSFSIRHEVPPWGIEYLRHEGGRISVDDGVRAMVGFRRADVLDPTVLGGVGAYEVVFCRNLLIYLEADARKRLLGSITDSLVEGGLLFVGHAEQMVAVSPRMKRIDSSHAFALERIAPAAAGAPATVLKRVPEVVRVPTRFASEVRITPAAVMRPAATVKVPERAAEATLEGAQDLADAGRIRESEEMIRTIIARKGPSAAALELLGTLRQALNDGAGAKALFEQALYLEPTRTTSLLQLALIHEGNGEKAKAERLWERVRRAQLAGNDRGVA
jgi:chemotaxis protein methyltransferase WspC